MWESMESTGGTKEEEETHMCAARVSDRAEEAYVEMLSKCYAEDELEGWWDLGNVEFEVLVSVVVAAVDGPDLDFLERYFLERHFDHA